MRSADHARLLPDGRPAVSEYRFELYTAGATVPFHWISLGKPAPAADGNIRFDFSGLVGRWPLPDGVHAYEARVSAVGPLGTGRSTPSNPFTLEAPGCRYSVSPADVSMGAGADTASLAVTTDSGCAWTASSGVSWIAVSPASGRGNGPVALSIAANPSASSRTGTATVAGKTVTVAQAGTSTSCTVTLSPGASMLGAAGGSASVTLKTSAGCGWAAASPVSWIRLSKSSGTGGSTIGVTVKPYRGKYPRGATVTIGARPFTVTQHGACAPELTPTRLSLGAAGAKKAVRVSVPDGCRWSASSDRNWLTVSPESGTDAGSLKVVAAPNPKTRIRRATVEVGGRTVEVVQAARLAAAPDSETEAGSAEPAAAGLFSYYLAEEAAGDAAAGDAAAGTVISIANPSERAVTASLSFVPEGATPVEHTVSVPARTQVTLDPFDVPGLAAPGFAVAVAADGPVAVNRAVASHTGARRASAATAAPAGPTWVLAKAAAGDGREPAWRVGNPNATSAEIRVRTLLPDGHSVLRHIRIAPLGRSTIRVDDVEPEAWALEEDAHGDESASPALGTVVVESTNGQPVAVERAAASRDARGREPTAWMSPELTAPGARWLVAGAETGGAGAASSWLRVTNASARAAVLEITLIPELESGALSTRTVVVGESGTSRLDLGDLFPEADGQRFGVLVEAQDPAARLVVERVTWWTAPSRAASVRAPGVRLGR